MMLLILQEHQKVLLSVYGAPSTVKMYENPAYKKL